MRNIIALVPMKGNSERVPSKNLKLFIDKPLYHAICHQVIKSKYINAVIINTDSPLITEDVNEYFADFRINKRLDYLLGDFVPMNDIINYDLKLSDGQVFVQTHSTNPLLKWSGIIGQF
jgi:CMP-N-acetylneuraminic acid synthetase